MRNTFKCFFALDHFIAHHKIHILNVFLQTLKKFIVGFAAMRYFTGRDDWKAFAIHLAVLAALIAATGFLWQSAAAVGAALFIVFVKFRPWKILSVLGAISYSLYLVHVPIGGKLVNLGLRVAHEPWQRLSLSAAALALSIAAAYVFHRLIERPAVGWSRRVKLHAG